MTISFDRFKIIKECKGNKSNRIFIVEEKSTNQTMILKIIKIHDVQTQLREIEVHRKLNHKHVIKLIEYDVSKSYIILLIEYAKYGDLFTHLPKLGELSEKTVLKFYYQVVQSVHYLQSIGFTHRDIKPENILITKKFSPRLADFGTSSKTDIIKNTYCGTLEYMAPEIMARKQQSEKVDIWALGILLYEMMHDCTPFKGENVQTIQKRLESGKLKFKTGLNPKIANLITLILKFEPTERPTTRQILNDAIFSEFQSKKEDDDFEVQNLRNEQFEKMIDTKVINRMKDYKNSVSAYECGQTTEADRIIEAAKNHSKSKFNNSGNPKLNLDSQGSVLKNYSINQLDQKGDSKMHQIGELNSVNGIHGFKQKDSVKLIGSKVNDFKSDFNSVFGNSKSNQNLPSFSEKYEQSIGSESNKLNKSPQNEHPLHSNFNKNLGFKYDKAFKQYWRNEEQNSLSKKNCCTFNDLNDGFKKNQNNGAMGPRLMMIPLKNPFVNKEDNVKINFSMGKF